MKKPVDLKIKNARNRVEALKVFYNHIILYCIVNIVLFLVRGEVLQFFQDQNGNKNFIDWVDWNILVVPIFWGIGLLFHAAKVYRYKLKFIKNWEEKQLKKYLKEE
ncbi:2TM domain-containing protein [Aequorivita marisscotiae]|uniref:2TM domain-containing protein n=1 Tax=Aequorivita marisscotiae TaxID=3040348 RepID=A0ABY8KQN5_9FLAO|nr:2TM domain-containing protein [Aequorivita sp. Ant34-E75]WGF91784.1 2TM domain-containing protein [Aequorivita sp. Ant34-E75]